LGAIYLTFTDIRIGQFFLIGVPGEFTTMSGRRLRQTVRETLIKYGAPSDSVVVIAGLSNAYSHYIATLEEYAVQRYEGASTIFGPHSLEGYQQEYSMLAKALILGETVPPGPSPPPLNGDTLPAFLIPVVEDFPPILGYFGEVHVDANSTYQRGDTASVSFWGANPRNNFLTQNTFLTVELQNGNQWTVIADDGVWETKFFWESVWLLESIVTVTWDIPMDAQTGSYRIRTYGYSKDIFGDFTPYTGTSKTFVVQ